MKFQTKIDFKPNLIAHVHLKIYMWAELRFDDYVGKVALHL